MQKDTVITTISSVALDATNSNTPIVIRNINDVAVNGQSLGLGGYLDIGLYDTMEDLFVNFIGAVVFSLFSYFYVKHEGRGKLVGSLVPQVAKGRTRNEGHRPYPHHNRGYAGLPRHGAA